MDGNDFYDYFVVAVYQLGYSDLAKLADFALPENWMWTQKGPDDVAEKIAVVIHDEYFNTGAADTWGPRTFADWYIDNALKLAEIPVQDVVH